MTYIAFARKYRPQTFDDIIGQSHVTTTLKNAISQDRVAHAYLFAGPRGVGKTTAARILAKALNCEKGPSAKPCNKCAVCAEIVSGSSLDVLEIDGASNRGIDEIRTLRENVKFAPTKGKFKIYIIDEVHMLTGEAFNALLKTLEEPPQHVKFIFATTQAHKVPPTILSRCQRFDFRRIASKEVVASLKNIAKAEGLDIDDEALGMIAKYSDGGMRDAQVMLDQITSSSSKKVKAADVAKMLGTVEDDALFGLSGAIKTKDAVKALGIVDSLVNEGKDVAQTVLGLIEHFRNIAVAKVAADSSDLIDAGGEKIQRYKEEAEGFTVEEILYSIYTLSNAVDFIRKASLSRVPLEAALIKLTINRPIVPLDEIAGRVEALEKLGVSAKSAAPIEIASSAGVRPQPPRNDGEKWGQSPPQVQQRFGDSPHFSPPAKAPEKPAGGGKLINIEDIHSEWLKIINYIMPKKISIASYLQEGYPVGVGDKTLSIGFSKELQFHKEVLDSPENRAMIEEAIKEVLGAEFKVTLILTEPVNLPKRRTNGSISHASDDPDEIEPLGGEVDPIVKSAMEIFGGDMPNGGSRR